MLNQEPVVEVVAHDNHIQGGEVELQDFDKAYENVLFCDLLPLSCRKMMPQFKSQFWRSRN